MRYTTHTIGALALMCISISTAFSQAFTGPSVGIGAVHQANTLIYTPYNADATSQGKDNLLQLDASYGIPVMGNFITTLGGAYNFGNSDYGDRYFSVGGRPTKRAGLQLEDQWSLYVAPGYVVHDKLLVYGKVAYHHANGTYTESFALTSGKSVHHGVGFGVGASYALTPHVEVNAEIQTIDFGTDKGGEPSGKPDSTSVGVKAAYRF